MRTAVALVLVAGLVGSLAACSTPANTPSPEGCAASGSVSDGVKVSGDLGAEPEVTFEAPLTVKSTQRTVSVEGEGRAAATNDLVVVDFAVYNATTGLKLDATDYTEGTRPQFTVSESLLLVGLAKTLECSQAGSRVVGVIPGSEAFGETGSADLGVGANEGLLFVIDVDSVASGVADGKPVEVEDDTLPTVELAKDGTATITIPDAAPPADFKLALLKQGDGDEVAEGDTVTVQYQGVNWNTKTVFDQSWGKGATSFATTGVVPGFSQGLVGQKVGSQVLVVIPPELGYGPSGGTGDGSISATDTIVFVIDILATSPAAAG